MSISPTQLIPGLALSDVEPDRIVQVVAAIPVGDTAGTLICRIPDSSIRERLLTETDFPVHLRGRRRAADHPCFGNVRSDQPATGKEKIPPLIASLPPA